MRTVDGATKELHFDRVLGRQVAIYDDSRGLGRIVRRKSQQGGADSRKIGLFEAAHKGTLFLDEIGEMPLDMQVKLLRVIQEEAFLRLGSTTLTHVDVRIMSATHQDLDKMVQEGTFRQDLFYRLNVINIQLPALRERKEDIQDLMHFFIRKHTPEGETAKKLQKGLIPYLEGYHWPGNIRQLENGGGARHRLGGRR